ncbi:hypothetical protein DPMN_097407 [Dreissena polymorpha]|uniref:Uncharacterized protein n=1 Tax=Dreissena polymorpha TaxID=45954 RepID=A0A9D4R4Q4_DREPO|nr:hypothetical protein DPMN_097407 [Dreissena polymorpha]
MFCHCFSYNRLHDGTRVDKYPVTLKTTDDILQHQSPGKGQDGDRTTLSLSESRSTSGHMVTTVSRSLPDGIGQGHRPMPDQLAAAIQSSSGDNTGHDMTGTSPGTGPVTGPWHRGLVGSPGTGPVTGPWHRSPGTVPVTGDRSMVPGTGPVTGPWHRGRVRSPVKPTGHRS